MTYSHLNYSDDYDLDVVASTSGSTKKQIIFNKRKVIVESKIRVKGSMIKPYVNHLKVTGKMSSMVEVFSSYQGSIGLTSINPIKGSLSVETATPYGITGTSKLEVSEKVLLKGEKDYTSLIGVLNKYISNTEHSIVEGYTKLITSYPFK